MCFPFLQITCSPSSQESVWKEGYICQGSGFWYVFQRIKPSQAGVRPHPLTGIVPCPPLSPLAAVTLPSRLCRKSFSAVTLERKREHKMAKWCSDRVLKLWFPLLQKVAQLLHKPQVRSEPARARSESVSAIKSHISLCQNHHGSEIWEYHATSRTILHS